MKSQGNQADFAHSLTDLMSGVAVMFLVVAAIFMVQATQAKKRALSLAEEAKKSAEKDKANAAKFKDLESRDQRGIDEIESLRQSLDGNPNVELLYDKKKDPRLLTIVFNRNSLRFDSGTCQVDGETRVLLQRTLRDIFPRICTTVGEGLRKSITLEGHTDNLPPMGVGCVGIESARHCTGGRADERCRKETLESNVKLSAARAQYVFFEAREALKDKPVVAQCLDRSFMVAGRGPMDPLDGEAWDKPRAGVENDKNRRVVIKVRVTVADVERAP